MSQSSALLFEGKAVFRGTHAHTLLEVFAKERLVGDVQLVGNILDALGAVAQQHAQLQHHIFVYPVVGRALRHLLHHVRQVLRRDTYLLGIPADAPLRAEVLL